MFVCVLTHSHLYDCYVIARKHTENLCGGRTETQRWNYKKSDRQTCIPYVKSAHIHTAFIPYTQSQYTYIFYTPINDSCRDGREKKTIPHILAYLLKFQNGRQIIFQLRFDGTVKNLFLIWKKNNNTKLNSNTSEDENKISTRNNLSIFYRNGRLTSGTQISNSVYCVFLTSNRSSFCWVVELYIDFAFSIR